MPDATAPAPTPRPGRAVTYFEDVEVGAVLETPGLTLTETHAALFGGFAGASTGGEGTVPELLPLCVSSGLGWRIPKAPLAVAAFMGFEWQFHLPLRVGDTIRSRSYTTAKRGMREGGVMVEHRDIVNQRGEVVQSGRLTLLIERRPAA